MARTVREIMNPHLLSLRHAAPADETLEMILEFGVTAVPVLDAESRPIGVSSLRDLVRVRGSSVEAPITRPATTVALNASIASVAETMATTNRHHLVVVDANGRAVGMVSTLDVIRALIGHPVNHPSTFLSRDPTFGVWWSGDETLAESSMHALPTQPGVLVLVRGGVDVAEETVWAEATRDLRARATELLSVRSQSKRDHDVECSEKLEHILDLEKNLRVRHTVVLDAHARGALAARMSDRIASAPPPGGT